MMATIRDDSNSNLPEPERVFGGLADVWGTGSWATSILKQQPL